MNYFVLFIFFALLFVVLAIAQRNGQKYPVLTWVVVLAAFVAHGLGSWQVNQDIGGQRQGILDVEAKRIKILQLERGTDKRVVENPSDIAQFFRIFQSVHDVHAHHSHPIDSCRVKFQFQGTWYQYDLGRDSERPQEYWVMEVPQVKLDLGRIESAELGPLIDKLLKGNPTPTSSP